MAQRINIRRGSLARKGLWNFPLDRARPELCSRDSTHREYCSANTGSSPGSETGKEKSLCNKNMENVLLTAAAAFVFCTWSRRKGKGPSVQEGAENGTEQILQELFRERAQGHPCSALSAPPPPLCQEIQTPTRVKEAHPSLCRAEYLNNYKQLFIITYIIITNIIIQR